MSPAQDTGATPSSAAPLIRLRGVEKIYREGREERSVLRGIDGDIATGELVVLLGKSGSGKSTLLNLLGGIDHPTAGIVEVAGRNLGDLDEEGRTLFRRRDVGFVFQAFNLIPTLTVDENVLLPLELLYGKDVRTKGGDSHRRHARELLAAVGLADRGESFPDRLSGGEQQRLALARALVHEPRLVLADEPTGNLDAETGDQVLELLDRLTRRAGRTLVMATHSRQVAAMADRVFALERGKLSERGVDRERSVDRE